MTDFEPATGNYYFEVLESSKDYFGDSHVSCFHLDANSSFLENCIAILNQVQDEKVTHILLPLELYTRDLDTQDGKQVWQWDILASVLNQTKSQVTIAIFVVDGVYELHQALCRLFLDAYPNTVFLVLDVELESKYIPSASINGPSFLPFSQATLSQLKAMSEIHPKLRSTRFSFLGRIFGARRESIRRMVKGGVEICVNPHLTDSSGLSQYLKYMKGLRDSEFTLNFASADTLPVHQLKRRMIESALMGSVALTDNLSINSHLLQDGSDFIFFEDHSNLKALLESLPNRLHAPDQMNDQKLLDLATKHFWRTFQTALKNSNLPSF
jgi:hypothetical protein